MNTVWVIVTCAAFIAAIDVGDGVDNNAYGDSPSRAKMFGFGGAPQSSGTRGKLTAQTPSTARGNQGQIRRPGNGGSYRGNGDGLGTQDLGVTGKQKAGPFGRQNIIGLNNNGPKSATGSSRVKLDGKVQNVDTQNDPAQSKKVLHGLAHRAGQNDWRQNLANKQSDDADTGNYNMLKQNLKNSQVNRPGRGSNQQPGFKNFDNNRQHGTKDFGEGDDEKHENDDFGEDDDQQNGINEDFGNDHLQQEDDDFSGMPDDDGPEGPPPPPPPHNHKRPPPPPPPPRRGGGKNGPPGGKGRGRGGSRDETDQQQPNGNHQEGPNRQHGHGDTTTQKHSDGNRPGTHREVSNPQGAGEDGDSPKQQSGNHRGGPNGQGGRNNFPQQHSAGRNQ